MKKIPTLFKREFQNHIVVYVSPDLSDETLSWVLDGEGEATVKIDGACCAFIDGVFYKRYDAKKNKKGIMKKPPEGSIPCDEPDPVTGHWPHWEPVREEDPGAKWYLVAYENAIASGVEITEGTYEAIGPHFQNNPYHLGNDTLVRHGTEVIDVERSFEGIRELLRTHPMEGLVFWKDGIPRCKIKRKDFGFPWPV